jgi:hypothetical protein|uniref:Uncharacterized protein n=1 Tax=viral metagenome TaxID=1070528 RepID=A0A6H1ZB61_9ZZZZ
MTTFLSGAFAGLLVGGFIRTMVMAILNYARATDEEYGADTGTDPYPSRLATRARYEGECG